MEGNNINESCEFVQVADHSRNDQHEDTVNPD